MPFGECTITLEDVVMLLGLKISGAPITGYATMDWGALVQRLLCMTPPESMLAGGQLRMSWIDRHFSNVSIFVWQPYLELLPTLPPYCFEDSQVWRSIVLLINFHIVDHHYADRVMRQFGMVHHIPAPPIHPEKLHDLSLGGKDITDWSRMHVQFVQEWQSRLHRVWTQPACDTPHLSNSSEYMVWYRKHTRRWISPSSAKEGYVVSTNLRMYLNNYL
uniref:Serine/threonine protein phosphatase 7 long form isogeny n=1 Tax=Cajanus cajan TaxID=3821 RepID=A0A151T5P6_CAJCA|nr:Serine/threonine protein phosphatase 7 long form isogeny [Cajanus cajan]